MILFYNKQGQVMKKRQKSNKALKIFGNIIMILAIIFIAKKLISYDVDYSQIFLGNSLWIYLLLMVVYAFCVISMSIPWKNMVYIITGEKIDFIEVAVVSTKANVMKYIPGNVFQYIGRNELAVNKGLKHADIAISTILDVIINLTAIFSMTIIFFYRTFVTWGKEYIKWYHWTILTILVFAVFIVAVCFRERIFSRYGTVVKRIGSKEGILTVVKNIITYCFLSVITTAIYMVVLFVVGREMYSPDTYLVMAGAILVSWILGFITPGAPGGIGIRETILVMLLNGIMSEEVIVLGAVVNRVVSILGDLLAMVIMFVFSQVKGEGRDE